MINIRPVDKLANDSIFDCDSDSKLHEYKDILEKITSSLNQFGLTKNQIKIYLCLIKYGPQTAPSVFKFLKMPRTETYHLLNSLQQIGIVESIVDHPITFVGVPFNKTLQILIDSEKERIHELEAEKDELEKLWDQIPNFFKMPEESREDKLQILVSQNNIVSKIKQMLQSVKNEVLVFGSEKDFLRLYHAEILDILHDLKITVKFITSCSDNSMKIFNEFNKKQIKQIPNNATNNLCFIIKDDSEVIFNLNNVGSNKEMLAIWTNSASIHNSLKQLFELNWTNSYVVAPIQGVPKSPDFDFMMKEIKQERLIMKELDKQLNIVLRKKKT